MHSSTPSVSCLVISRTAQLLNGLLGSLEQARRHWGPADEILCSWNGSDDEEARIQPPSGGPAFRIAVRTPYHFASNMNRLAEQASGEILILLNDDLILDRGSLDQALQILTGHRDVGLVGGRLRTPKGLLGHAGILFNSRHLAYNRLRPERLGPLLQPSGLEPPKSGPMPAVTGALMALRRRDYLQVRLREDFHICGEDVALCLDLRRQLGLSTYYAMGVGAVHAEKSSRGQALDHHDEELLSALIASARAEDPALEQQIARWASEEADILEQLVHRSQADRHTALQQATQLQTALEAAQGQLHQSQAELESEHLQRRQSEATRAACEERLQLCQETLHRQEEHLQALISSRSWTLMGPYRALGTWFCHRRSSS